MAKDEEFTHQFDQTIASMLEEGYLTLVGPELVELTAKGTIHALTDYLTGVMAKAVTEKRDFLPDEQEEIIAHLLKTGIALINGKGGTHDDTQKRA